MIAEKVPHSIADHLINIFCNKSMDEFNATFKAIYIMKIITIIPKIFCILQNWPIPKCSKIDPGILLQPSKTLVLL